MHTKKIHAAVRKPAGALLAGLVVLLLCPGFARSQKADVPRFGEESVKQEKIYRSRGENVPEGYITSRSLRGYVELLPTDFSEELRRLGPSDGWLDIGAGRGQAILDYYSPEYATARGRAPTAPDGKARAVAVSIEDRRTDQWREVAITLGSDRIRYLSSKRLREYTREELGKFQIITDVYGGFSYTENLSLFMEKVLSFLDVGGSFFTLVQSVHLEDGKDRPDTWYLTELIDSAGHDVKVCSWLKSIACVKVSCESKSSWEAPTELIHVRKTCDNVSVPALIPLQFEAGNPPGRRFQVQSAARPATASAP